VLIDAVVEWEIVGDNGGSGAYGGIDSNPGDCGYRGDAGPGGLSRVQERRTRGPAVSMSTVMTNGRG
jgi:hypothetical protein